MLIAKKIRVIPTEEQEKQLWMTAGVSRWAHNYVVASKIEDPTIKEGDLRKKVTQLKKTEDYSWLKEVGNEAIKQSISSSPLCQLRQTVFSFIASSI